MPRTIGLMSGTSLDGVDAAWLDTDGVSVAAFGPALTVSYDAGLRADLREILDMAWILPPYDPRLPSVIERLTDYHVRAIEALGCAADLVGFHGQTILHRPQARRTWQIGNAAALAQRLGLPVVHDFRSADVAAGGEGAPMAPVYHAALAATHAHHANGDILPVQVGARNPGRPVAADLPAPLAVLNIGGVANATWIGRDGALLAFDTGPGNGPLDDWVSRHTGEAFDVDGELAGAGTIDQDVLGRLMGHPYFALPGPKSLDRLDFTRALAQSGLDGLSAADGAATLVGFTVASVAAARFPDQPRRWLVCGGGRLNPAIMEGLRSALGVPVEPVEAVGWSGDALEAQCFAFLAARVVAGLPLSYPSTTGVSAPMPGGRIARPA